MIHLCAFLGPDETPFDLLTQGREHSPELLSDAFSDSYKLDQIIAPLRQYSLITRTQEALFVHCILQAVTQDRMADEEKKNWAEVAILTVSKVFPYDSEDVRTWPECARFPPHALAATKHAEELAIAADATGRLLNQVGAYLQGRVAFHDAKVAFERALKILEKNLPTDHHNLCIVQGNLSAIEDENKT